MTPRPQIDRPDESTLLAYVEDLLPDDQSAAVESYLAGHSPRSLESLRKMRADRGALIAAGRVVAPAGLVDDVLAVVERTMLIEDDPVAPVVTYRRPGEGAAWKRWSLAAGFVLLLGGAGTILFTTLWYRHNDSPFLTHRTPEPAREIRPTPPSPPSTRPEPIFDDLATISAEPTPAEPVLVEPPLASQRPTPAAVVDPPLDLGIAVSIATPAPDRTMKWLRDAVTVVGGSMVETSDRPRVHTAPRPGLRRSDVSPRSDALEASLAGLEAELADQAAEYLTVDEAPLSDEARREFRLRGYDHVLVGTPSRLIRVLQVLNGRGGHAVAWNSPDADRALAEVLQPAPPRGREWSRALAWWLNPKRDLDVALRAQRSQRPEPVIVVPLRMFERDGVDR